MAAHAKHVGIFTATRWELNAVRRAFTVEADQTLRGTRCVIGRSQGCRLFLFQTGIGSRAVSEVMERALTGQKFDLLVSSGFACALSPAAVGDLLIATEVVPFDDTKAVPSSDRVFPCSPENVARATQIAQRVGLAVHVGRYAAVPRILSRAAQKHLVADRTGAVAADMESATICESGQVQDVPVLVVRAASDLLEEDLPLDFNHFLGSTGWVRGMMHCLAHPTALGGLNRMRSQSRIAADRLASFFDKFFNNLGSEIPAVPA